MCRLRSDAPSSHHTGPRSPSARLTSSDGLVCVGFRLAVGRLPGVAYRPSGRHQPVDEIGSLAFIETWGLPCATACRGRRSSDRLASPGCFTIR